VPKGIYPGNRKQFCVRGHDTYLVGRSKYGYCKTCRYQEHKIYMGRRKVENPRFTQDSEWKRKKITIDGHYFTLQDYNRIYQIQGGCCKMCGKHQTALSSILVVDHDHSTKLFRGLLCSPCNISLGHYEKIKTTAISYLSMGVH
jgi:hypothetical protein